MSLTNVTLINEEDRQGSTSNSPRLDVDLATVTVEIAENDNSRGLLQFVVSQLSVDEDVGSIQLVVERGDGVFGRVAADFSVAGIMADSDDFSPQSGTVEFEMAETSNNITVYVVNDSEPELEEVSIAYDGSYDGWSWFDCCLLCPQSFVISLVNPQDGAAIGDMNSVVVTINRNDDVNGAFSFDSVLVSHNTRTNTFSHMPSITILVPHYFLLT